MDTRQHANQPTVSSPALAPRSLISGSGLLLGFMFFAASLTPSLVPRDATFQGLLGGALFSVGYAIAVVVLRLWRWLELPEPNQERAHRAAILAAVAGLGVLAYGLYRSTDWQNSIRALMGLELLESNHPLSVLALAAGTAFVIFLAAYLVRVVSRLVERPVARVVPPKLAVFTGLVAAFLLFGSLVNGVLVRSALTALDSFYAQLDQFMPPESQAPSDPMRTGSAQSLISWDTMGRAGRQFLDGIPTTGDLAAFWSDDVTEPRRIYLGLNAADDPQARAELALQEMIRVGAFDRSIVVVAIPTGTGFMDQPAIETLEYLHKGDVATVAMQYSYLQSPFSLIFEPGYGSATGRALLRTVYNYWTDLPEEGRSKLYLYGLSLGALASETSVRLHEVIGDPFDGALWAGPPFLGPMHQEVTRERNPGSPEWLPVYEDGAFVRFMNQDEMTDADAPWGPMRIVYLQHGSDPIVFFSFDTFWWQPAWLRGERAPDVTQEMRWYPIVTGLQLATDMALANDVPLGFGHQYAPRRYLDGWISLTSPDASAADLDRLRARFAGPR